MRVIENILINDGYVTNTYMEEHGKAMFVLSYYEQMPFYIWFSDFHVENAYQGQGIGDEMLSKAIGEAIKIASHTERLGIVHLSVKPKSWMEEWYVRKGFKRYTTNDGWDLMFMLV